MEPKTITTVEELCQTVGETLNTQDEAQARIEAILNYLYQWDVIEDYNADRLDWIFSDNENN